MSSKKRSREEPSQVPEPVGEDSTLLWGFGPRTVEALGLTLLICAVALCLALFSFDPSDRSGTSNWVGPLGVRLANGIFSAVGLVGYVAGLVAIGVGGATLLGHIRIPSIIRIISAGAMVTGTTVLAHLLFANEDVWSHPAGGWLGATIGGALIKVAGPAGAGLFGILLMLVGVIGMTQWSMRALVLDGLAPVRWFFRNVSEKVGRRREATAAGRRREQEVMEAARSMRAQRALELKAKEEEWREKQEEKKRLAILKAEAKAEEKALKKLASEEARLRVEAALQQDKEPIEPKAGEEPVEVESPSDEAPETEDEWEYEYVYEDEEGDGEEEEDAYEYDEEEEDYVDEEEPSLELEAESSEPELSDAAQVISEIDRLGSPEGEGLGPLIHERKQVEADFRDDPKRTTVTTEPEKPVYELPPVSLLDYEGEAPVPIDPELLKRRAVRLEEKLKTYGVDGKVVAIRPGPIVTTYEYQPAPGVKVSKIANLSDDIAMSMEAVRVRIVAPIPGRGVVGIELPNDRREDVYLKEIIGHDSFKKSKSLLTLALGKDVEGEPQSRDLQKMPHLMIAGTTGSGKSVSVNAMVLSVLYKATPDQVKFIMVDPKMLELSLYNDIPHLLLPVVTDSRKASIALQWAVDEMERRYKMLSDLKVRDVETFNRRLERLRKHREKTNYDYLNPQPVEGGPFDPWPKEPLPESIPYIVVLIDEFADLMMVAPRDVEASVQRLAQKARAAGIHVLLATQRPSTDVITGVIKNNFPSRVAFRVASRHDSATIINSPGAENLLGRGDSLMLGTHSPTPERVHGAFVSEDEVERVVEFWKKQAKPKYDPSILERKEEDSEGFGGGGEEADEHYDQAVKIVTDTRRASISALQRRLRVGYNRAARMIEMMEEQGIVGPPSGPKGEREVMVSTIGRDGPVAEA